MAQQETILPTPTRVSVDTPEAQINALATYQQTLYAALKIGLRAMQQIGELGADTIPTSNPPTEDQVERARTRINAIVATCSGIRL